MALQVYGFILRLLTPLVIGLVHVRRWRGREDPVRYRERYGITPQTHSGEKTLWIHAASVGEVISIFPLLRIICAARPDDTVLLTTTTRSSADYIAQSKRPRNLVHQYAPLDHPTYVGRFLSHWKPLVGFFIESEIWPNLITLAHQRGTRLALVNARLSPTSFKRWKRRSSLAREILGCFDRILAQDHDTAQRLNQLGLSSVDMLGNIKRDAPDLTFNADRLLSLKEAVAHRPLWLAASTHADEESVAMRTHHALLDQFPDLLTVIVPRHPDRVGELTRHPDLKGAPFSLYSKNQPLTADTQFLFGDTIGDMGVFYRLAPICLIGGTLIPHGGQNPLEAARLDCAILHGPSITNFREIFADLSPACTAVDRSSLVARLTELLAQPNDCKKLQEKAREIVARDRGTTQRIAHELLTIIESAEPNSYTVRRS